ncbi:hypothetical protein QA646_10070 [Rhizobium sp. CB3090]|nr:hypothetical protein [Rhizobium sp. CB3090]WFU07676.1 hypothetical protein QA646_10070 [Rhizobium sp. CB3090]
MSFFGSGRHARSKIYEQYEMSIEFLLCPNAALVNRIFVSDRQFAGKH